MVIPTPKIVNVAVVANVLPVIVVILLLAVSKPLKLQSVLV